MGKMLHANGKTYCNTFEYQGMIFCITQAGMDKMNEITEPIPAHVYNCDYLLPLIKAEEIIQIGGTTQ